MIRTFMIAMASAIVPYPRATAFAQGTASEARTMLDKAVVAVKADKAKTLDTINKGEGGSSGLRSLCILLQHRGR